jgi:hypothetical protein
MLKIKIENQEKTQLKNKNQNQIIIRNSTHLLKIIKLIKIMVKKCLAVKRTQKQKASLQG